MRTVVGIENVGWRLGSHVAVFHLGIGPRISTRCIHVAERLHVSIIISFKDLSRSGFDILSVEVLKKRPNAINSLPSCQIQYMQRSPPLKKERPISPSSGPGVTVVRKVVINTSHHA